MALNPLVSVVIPCYNHGRYLQTAINSVLAQSYQNFEIIVIDDGSVDNTRDVAQQNKRVQYIYQNNQGLSAARNKGIDSCKGDYLVFLDADDYLYETALAINLSYIQRNERLAFVSGSHDKIFTASNTVQPVIKTINADHYTHLLKGNYIGMHATVMYRRWVFNEFLFDTSLKACEDYDLYLKVTRKHPVLHHANKVAAYCFHGSNMSNNAPLMLKTALKVLNRQKACLSNPSEVMAYSEGVNFWKSYYAQELYTKLWEEKGISWRDYYTLLRYTQNLTFHEFYNISKMSVIYKMLQRTSSKRITKKLRSYLPDKVPPVPLPGKVRLGDFNRLIPFSRNPESDRGGSMESYYIGNFLGNESLNIKGSVLEFDSNQYTCKYGADRVENSHILHLDKQLETGNDGCMEDIRAIPDETFDCIILAQKLNLVYDFQGILRACYRILKPEGVMMITVPGIIPANSAGSEKAHLWTFTDKSVLKLLEETFPECTTEVYSYGNVFTASASLYGLGYPEIPYEMLAFNDPDYQVIITAKTTK
ncbi:glycosyltransferase [Pontibacter roseus]|uniref:glycosyltransferase n=1 Tax=Pontibacter roseus TaxID=336989 RepID=UPI00036FF110|nr:glycosyltransferase [Pontibacter roseus]